MSRCIVLRLLYLAVSMSAAVQMLRAQDSSVNRKPRWDIEAYTEGYYSHDFSRPDDHLRPAFLYNHNRAGEVNINLAYLRGTYAGEAVRMNLALGAGTYMNANYAAEPGTLQFLLEASAGVRLSRQKKIWLDVGVIPSHLGFESAVSLDCWTPGRSLVAENSPYFETGLRLGYENDPGTWTFNLLALNGWQTIQRVQGNSMISWGGQVQYKPSAKWLFNYGNFIGTIFPDSARRLRHYHNFFAKYQLGSWGFIAGFDIGQEEKSVMGDGWNNWYTPVAIVRFSPAQRWAFAARGEYFSDPQRVVIILNGPGEFKCTGLSLNADYMPIPNAALRLEYRWLHNRDAVFEQGNSLVQNNHNLLFSLAVRL